MCRQLVSSVLMVLALVNGMWDITFPDDGDNTAVVLITECKGPVPFYAYDRFAMTTEFQTHMRVRRQPTPRGESCTFRADLMRATVDGSSEYIADSATASD